ncbi:hypothetical protein A3F65_02535 [Candidatus Saccharibacteria bacterium RIFCSPHIGHO2_12_FULL_47_16b]|nr:MAG: hypothetical protein A3F65_02535 [Candidatus Saccharibacteria bacterium RIFCSPHIGHO2_12_FULL_47_16b]OGL40321.1 MAG: hypothetical protein A3J32_02490 [Candidatus Saccharibacteria bacterium RIFCSPLOWO2_02_FULL_46_7]
MIQKIKKKLIILASVLTLGAPVAMAVPAYAQTVEEGIQKNLICGSNAALRDDPKTSVNECEIPARSDEGLSAKIKSVINILSAVIAVVAVIMIIYGGLRYVASGGKQESITAAKNTILYAIIGLIIVALAQAIVQFVLKGAT